MTEKELRRLSRLEVLELLLEQTKENERLRQEFEQLKNESATESETEKLYKLSLQLNSALSRVNEITNELKSNICKADPPLNPSVNLQTASPLHGETETPNSKTSTQIVSDYRLYLRIMYFLSKNDSVLDRFPPDIKKDAKERIRGILDARK